MYNRSRRSGKSWESAYAIASKIYAGEEVIVYIPSSQSTNFICNNVLQILTTKFKLEASEAYTLITELIKFSLAYRAEICDNNYIEKQSGIDDL